MVLPGGSVNAMGTLLATKSRSTASFALPRISLSGARLRRLPTRASILRHLAEHLGERRHTLSETRKVVLGDEQHVDRGARTHGRVAPHIGDHRHLSKVFAGAEHRQRSALARHLAFAGADHVDAVAEVALVEYHVARFEMLVADSVFAVGLQLR